MKKDFWFLLIYITLIVISAIVFIWWFTPYGPGVSPDSTTYIVAARNLIGGKGFTLDGSPITHYPPLYPILLAATNLWGGDLLQTAHILNSLLYGLNLGIIALAVYLWAGRNFFTTSCAVIFYLASKPLFELHSYAWSEPLFISLSLVCILSLSKYIEKPSRHLFITSALFLGLALITRYIGIGFIPAALIMVFVGNMGQPTGIRIQKTLTWLLLSCTPLIIWLARNAIVAGSTTNRSFVFHPVSLSLTLKQIFLAISQYLAPNPLPVGVRSLLFGLLSVVLVSLLSILLIKHFRDVKWHSMTIVLAMTCFIFSISYLLFLFISLTFFDAASSIDNRFLSPVFVFLLLGLFSGVRVLSQTLKKSIVWHGFLILVVLSILVKTPDAINGAKNIQKYGLGYTSWQWWGSESVAFIKALPNDVKIYSNGSDVVSLYSDNVNRSIPAKLSATTRLANPNYNQGIEAMCKDIKDNKAILIFFNSIHWRWYYPNQEEVNSICQLSVIKDLADGTAYGQIEK